MDSIAENKKKSLLRQLCAFGIGPILGMFVSILTVPITTRLLIPEEFGKTSMFTLVQTLFNLVALLGMDQSFVRFYNYTEIKKEKLIQTSLLLPVSFCVLIVVVVEFFREKISIFMFGQFEPVILWSFIIFLPSLVLNRFCLLSIRMSLRGKVYSFLQLCSQILNFLFLIVLLVFYEKSFKSVVYANVCSIIIGTIIAIILCDDFSFFSFIKNFFKIDRILLKKMLIYGLPLLPASILTWVMNAFDKFSLRTWCDFNQLGVYTAAFKIVAILNIVQSIFTTTWTPMAYKWYEEKVNPKCFERISTIVMTVMSLLFSILVVSRKIIMIFLGSEYSGASDIFVFLLFSPVLLTVSETVGLGINFEKKTIYNLYISFFATILNFIGNYFLVRYFGALGAAVSTCICNVIFFFARVLISRKIWYKFSVYKYFINILLLLLLCVNMVFGKNPFIEWMLFFIIAFFNVFIGLRAYNWKID